MDIKDIQGNIILSVSISQECEHVEELMKSGYIQLSWNSNSKDVLPAGSYIEYKGEKYSLLEPYSPTQEDEVEFTYQPQFQSKIMIWGKTPFFMYTYADNTITNREPDWNLTDNPANFMSVVVDAIKNETGDIWTYSIGESLPASASLSFQSIDIFSALNQIANAFETEWWVDKVNKVIHLSKASHGDAVLLEVGGNVNTPSVTSSKEGYYTRFYAFGSTRNIVQDYKGANVNNLVNKRLTLDPVKYPGGYKDIYDNLSSDEIFSKVLIFDDIYPSSKLKISDVRVRLMWTIDPDTKEKIQIGTDSEGNPVYDQYAIWYFQVPEFAFDNTTYDKDTNPQGMKLPDKNLSVHFQDGPLSGREFELNYHDKGEKVSSADGSPFQIKEGDYEILFVKEGSLVIPMISNLVPADGNEIILFNIRMPEEYTVSAYLDLESALDKEMERMSSDLNNYQFSSNPVVFGSDNPNLSLGRKVTYKNGTYSYSTRVIKLVTRLDYDTEQTITVGNEQIKGNTQEIKEEVASANKDINLLAILNSTTNSLTQAYNRTQQLMLEGFAAIKDMWRFDPNNADTIYSKYNVYSEKALSSKGLALGSGGSGEGGATALYQLNDVSPNASGSGVLGAGPGKVLTYGTDGKWYAADAVGLDETALGKYLTDNNYAKKSDIPSLSGYATESWVLGKNYITSDALGGYATQSWVKNQGYATSSALQVVSDKLNDFLTGTDTDGIINKWKELESFLAGQTQTSTLAELLAVKADKATTLSGYGITDAYTKSEINSKLSGYVTTTALNTALAKKVDVAFLGKVFGFIGGDNSEVSINDMEAVITSIKAKFGLWTDEYLSSKGLNPNAGAGTGEGATALYQLNDVAQNANGTGVLGAEAGKVLTYGSDGKWYAAKAGMDEDALSNYLTVNNYAKKSDIPSLDGYATQSWVNTALGNKVDKVSGMGLSQNNFTDALLKKLNGIAEGANKYILPVAKAAVLGGVMIGSTLNASATGVLNLPEVMTTGTYAKVTTDIYGRVTAGSSLSAGDIPALGISKITGLQDALDKKVSKSDFATEFDKAMQRWFVRDTANKGLHPADYDSEAVGIYSDSYVSSKGVNTGTGGGTGGASSLGDLNNVGSWADGIPTVDRIMVQRKGATHWESLNLSDIGLNESQLADYLTTNNYAKKSDIPSLAGYATQSWVNGLLDGKVDKVEGKGLSANDFTDTLLNKLNSIEAGANKYVLPTASFSVLGGVKVGSTLAIANGVLNLKSGIATAGTYTKVTVDTYGRVTAGTTLAASDIPTLAISKISGLQTALDGKANTDGSNATGTWGISITGSSRRLYQAPLTNEDLNDLTYTNHSGKMYYAGGDNTTVNFPSDAYGLMVWRIAAGYTGQIGFGSNNNLYKRRIDNNGVATGWMRIIDESNFSTILDTRYVTKTFLSRLFGAMDADGNEIAVNNTSTVIDSIKAKVGLWTEQYLSSKGLNPNSGGGGSGSDYDRLDNWSDYDVSKAGYVLSAGLGWDLNTRVESLESKSITLTTTGTGNGLASFTQTGNSVVFTKANFLTSHQTIYGLTLQKNGTSLGTYTPNSAAKTINITVPTKVSELSNDSGFALKSYVDGNFPKLTEGLIPASYLPSYVDDVIEAASLSAFPKTGESGKIYVALDTNLTYRWSGTTYVEISPSLALGETSNTAYAGDKGKANATAIAALKAITISAGTGLSGGGNLTANRTLSLKVATTTTLGGIKVGDRLSIDENGVLDATYTYTLPTASASVLGGVKVGTTLNMASSGVLDIKAVGKAGTYFKVTTDAYGRVTSGSNPTTLSGFGITDGFNTVAYSGSGNAITSATFSGHTLTLVKGTTFLTKATFDDLFEKVNIGTTSAPVYAIKAKYGLYTDQFLSSKGLNTGTSGGGGGSDYDRLDTWTDYDASKAGWVLSAGLGNDLNTRVTSLENGAAVTVTPSGTGAVVTGVTKAGTVITVTKGNLAFGSLTNKPTTISGYGITDAYTKAQADGAYVKKSGSAMTGGIDWTAAGEGLYAIKLGVSHYISIDGTSNSSMLHWTGGGTVLGSTKGTTTIRSNASNLSHNYNGTEYVILDARNYNAYAPTKTGTGASGTWNIDVTGYSKRLYFNQSAAVANTLMTNAGLYYNQVSSSTDTGYPTDYGHVIRLQRGVNTTLTSSQLVLDLFHQTGASGLNQLYLRTGYGDGSKMVWGSFVQLLHTGNYTSLITKLGTATVGGTAKGIYLNAGTPTVMSATVGSATLPVYMNAGTITACSTTLGVSITGTAPRLTTTELTNQDLNSYTYTNYSGKLYYAGGGNTTTNVPSGVGAYGLMVWRIASGYTGHLMFDSAGDFRARFYNGTTWSAWDKLAYITDNVASATKLQTARTINGTSFNGTANITTATWGTARSIGIVNSDGTGTAVTTSVNGSANVNLKLPATIKAALTGNATTATTLQTSRTLWGQSFNGSANVIGTLTGVESVVARSGRINSFLSYMDNSGNPAKGTICITLPNGWISSMNTYEIWVYEYSTATNASVITIGAYNYNGGGDTTKAGWVNIGYHTKGAYNKGVRLGYNGSKCVILLGNTTTTWLYPKVYLKTICTGHSNQTLWGGTSTISLITSESGYTNIVTPARMDEFFGDTSVTGKLIITGAGHFGYNYTTMTGGVNVIGNSATNGFCLYDGSGTTARIYRISDVLYITRGGDNAKGLRMDTAGNIYPGGNNTLTNGKSDARWANMFSVLLNVSGAATFSSTVTATGTIASTAGYLKSTLNGNTVQIGSQNSSWAHFQSSVPFYFNTRINVNGHLYPHTNNAFTSGGASNRWSNVFATAGNFSTHVDIGPIRISYDSANNALKVAKTDGTAAGLYAVGFLSSMGLATGTGGGGGGSDYDRLDSWSDYTADKAGYVLSAKLGNDLNTRVKSLEGGSALTVTTTGSGNAVTAVTKSGTTITVTKGTTFLTSHQSLANYVTTNTAQNITAQKTWTVSQRMANTSIQRVNKASGSNATGSHWYTADYAALQFGIGVFTTDNAGPRAYIGWTATPWTTSNNLTVSSTQLTYKANNILHAANYNDYAPSKTGTGASGTWGISISGGAAKLTTARTIWGQSFNGTANVSGSLSNVGSISFTGATATYSIGTASVVANTVFSRNIQSDTTLYVKSAASTSIIFNVGTTEVARFLQPNGFLGLGTTAPTQRLHVSGNVKATGYYFCDNGWFQNSAVNKGLYNSVGDARWYWNGSTWYADKAIQTTGAVNATQFQSRVATGTAPLTVASTTMVTNLNAQMVGGIGASNIPLEYDASYTPTGTAARWIRIAYFDYTSANGSYSGTFAISNNYSNNINKGLIFNVTTSHGTTEPVITQVGGDNGVFTTVRIVKDTTTTYPTLAKVYLEVYYNTTSAGNTIYVSYRPENRSRNKWTLYTSYTAGSVPTGYTIISQLTTGIGMATTGNMRVQGSAVILGSTNHNNRLTIDNSGRVYPGSTSTRRAGMYGVYDAAKIGHIWSMGTAYQIPDDGANFGNLYGFAYKHTNNTTGGTMATGHQAVWCVNGTPKVAIGENLWAANHISAGGNLAVTGTGSVKTLTIKNTEAIGHLNFSRDSYNYVTSPGNITFVVGGQTVGSAVADLTIQNGSLIPGTTNATSLGTSALRWSNTYTQLLNVAGAATLSSTLAVTGVLTASSTLNVNGVLNANNVTDATSTTTAGAVFDGGVGIAKQLRVGGNTTFAGNVYFATGGALRVPYSGSSWITLATRTNIIYGDQNQTEASAHALFRVKSYSGDAVAFGGLKDYIGFYGIYKATIDASTNKTDWSTRWDTTTGKLFHTGAFSLSGILDVAGVLNANNTTDSTSTTTGSIICDGGVGIAKQLRVGTTSTFTGKTTHNGGLGATTGAFSSTLSVTGVATFSNATDATSTTAAGVKVTGGLGVAKQLRVGTTSTFTGKTTHNGGITATTMTLSSTGSEVLSFTGKGSRKIWMPGDTSDHWGQIEMLYTPVSNVGQNIILSIGVGIGAIQLFSTNGTLLAIGQDEIYMSGVVHNTTGMYSDGYMSSKGLNDTSDMRLKNKVRDIFLPVKDIANAPAFEYTWKDGTPGAMVGSSAQYWQKVLSCSVREKKDGYLSMFYGHTAMVGLISLARHHENLEQRVARLEKENKEKDKTIEDLNQKYITLKNMYYGKTDSAC